ncbi:MAG: restriction endonuclease subunit S [Nitrospirota bacterium]
MIADLKPYAEYKESNQTWIGMVPAHWPVLPNRAIFSEVKDRNHPDEEMLSVTITKGIIQQKALLAGSSKKDSSNLNKSAYKLVCPRDLAYNKMRAWQGAIGVSEFRGIISPAYVVMRLRENYNPRYFHHLYRTTHFAKEAESWSYGITSDMWSLRPEHFKMIYTPLPSVDEQAAIVRFLDYVNHRIDRAIRAKKKVIALLNEQKQVIIHRAVTRGLDPNVSLKPSGIPLLGDIPKHWEVRPLKHWAKLNSRTLTDRASPEYEFRYLDIGTVGTGRLVREPVRIKFKQAPSRARRVLRQGDTIISTVRTYLKAVYFVDILDTDLVASTGFAVLSPGPDVLPEFLSIGVQSSAFIDRVTANSIGIAYPAIAEYRLGAFHLAIPPDKAEQAAILQYVRSSSSPFDTTIARTEREIALLREYRTRLIADVVTGKMDVREAAKKLPEETVESGIIDEDEILSGDEEMEESLEEERKEA